MNRQPTPEHQPGLTVEQAKSLRVLAEDEVHVWRVDLQVSDNLERYLWSLLDDDERCRADRFHFAQHRRRFVVARGALRTILAHYLEARPTDIRFQTNAYGKPFLASDQASTGLAFNLSHSNSLALVGIACHREIGVDLELVRADFATEEIAGRFFSPGEVAALQALPADARAQGFFNCWTRKEAFIKAKGMGLSMPLDRFDVSLAPGEPARLLSILDDPAEAGRWSLEALYPQDGYAAAVAVQGHGWRLQLWPWPEALPAFPQGAQPVTLGSSTRYRK